ncbi:U13-hexatoxin-Hi1a-like [Panulirus ornatus]|uniref:U13-hexatoxin-Hi1a-like n=1 Tax=Panulirus ornatus TaxID=150431 RepID=UPI003A8A8448
MELVIIFVLFVSFASALKGNSIAEDDVTIVGGECYALKDVGTCTGQEEAWYYSTADNRCVFFVYSGCGGNENRFSTRTACEETCEKFRCPDLDCPDSCTRTQGPDGCDVCACTRAEAEVLCNAPEQRGYCRALHYKWYWSAEKRRCVQFVYGGCGGNGNNFETEEMCLKVCSAV